MDAYDYLLEPAPLAPDVWVELHTLSDDEVFRPLWERGELVFLLAPEQQWVWYAFWFLPPGVMRIVLHWARRMGKTYAVLVCFLSLMIRYPDRSCLYLHPTQKTGKILIARAFARLVRTCPADLLPEYKKAEGRIELPNGSVIFVSGAESEADIDSITGQEQLAICLDEAGRTPHVSYALTVLMPMLGTMPGPKRFLLASNCAKGERHKFFVEFDKAATQGAARFYDIYDSTRYSSQEIEYFKQDAGGDLSPAWLTEYMGSRLAEVEERIVPEFSPRAWRPWVATKIVGKRTIEEETPKEMIVVRPPRPGERGMPPIVREVEPPEYYDRYVCADTGHVDWTVGLFGYYHFLSDLLVVTHEKPFRQSTVDVIAPEMDAYERAIWPGQPVHARMVDGDPLVTASLARLGWDAWRVDRRDPAAQVNTLRAGIATSKLAIHPRCTTLIEQLTVCDWNASRTSFARTEEHGHADAVATLVYLFSNVDWGRNPYPEILPSQLAGDHQISPKYLVRRKARGGLEQLAESMEGTNG